MASSCRVMGEIWIRRGWTFSIYGSNENCIQNFGRKRQGRRPFAKSMYIILGLKSLGWFLEGPITGAERPKAWIVFTCSNTGVVGSNLTRGMDVWVYSVFVWRRPWEGLILVQGVPRTVHRIKGLKKEAETQQMGCRAIGSGRFLEY
jgi:hypothetical protein